MVKFEAPRTDLRRAETHGGPGAARPRAGTWPRRCLGASSLRPWHFSLSPKSSGSTVNSLCRKGVTAIGMRAPGPPETLLPPARPRRQQTALRPAAWTQAPGSSRSVTPASGSRRTRHANTAVLAHPGPPAGVMQAAPGDGDPRSSRNRGCGTSQEASKQWPWSHNGRDNPSPTKPYPTGRAGVRPTKSGNVPGLQEGTAWTGTGTKGGFAASRARLCPPGLLPEPYL